MKTFCTSLAAVFLMSAPAWSSPIASMPIAPIQSATVNTPEKLHQSGHNAFTEGRFAEATLQWQQAANLYHKQGDRLKEAILLANLALAYRELGQWQEATSAITISLEIAKSLQPVTADVQRAIAQAKDTQGSLSFAQGKSEAALQAWQEALILHQQLNDEPARIRNTINQARAYQRLGLFIRSHQTIAIANESVMQLPDSLLKVELLHHIGNILLVIDEPAKSLSYLQRSQQILTKLEDSPAAHTLKSGILLDLGHLARTQTEDFNALTTTRNFYTEAIATAFYPLDRIYAQLSLADLLISSKQQTELDLLLIQMQPNIELLPLSRNGIDNRIRYAEILSKQGQRQPAAQLLAKAIAQAKILGDKRTYAYALSALAHLYEQNQQFPEAIVLTRQAIDLAQSNNADDLTYKWHWQLARILKATGQNEPALTAYSQAVVVLNSIQGDLASASANAQFSFQESVEPLYNEYVSLLLETSNSNNQQNNQQKLRQAQSVIESLKVAELVNFFRNDCIKTNANDISQIDHTAAVVYTISLNDRLEVLINLPNGNIKRYTTAISASEIESTALEFRSNLRDIRSYDYLEQSQALYNWTIRSLEDDLTKNKVKTLVIVSDQSLRNIPFTALHDGKQFLIEKYNLAVSPGLQLLESKLIAKRQANVLLVGISQSRFGFSSLPGVQQELDLIQNLVNNSSSNLLINEAFTSQSLQKFLLAFPVPIVHIATHGQFSSKANDTFIVAWDQKVSIEQLSRILQARERSDTSPLELLILSACQTALGDKRSALGLAGIAVRAGARSTIGSLWQISDEATAILMSNLYSKLADSNFSRAEALRFAQLTLLKSDMFSHPYFWSPFILLGNWQ